MKRWAWAMVLVLISCSLSSTSVLAADSTSISTTRPTQNFTPSSTFGGGTGIQTYYPDQTSTSVSPSNTNPDYFDSLPSCPGNPSDSTAPGAPVCPDINGKWTQNIMGTSIIMGGYAYNNDGSATPEVSRYCPDICRSKRYVDTVSLTTSAGAVYHRIVQFKPAMCPPGYSQMTSTTAGFDIVYYASGFVAVPNSQTDYNNILSQGGTCTQDQTYPSTYCSYSTNPSVVSNTNNCQLNVYGNYTDGTGTSRFGVWTSCPTATQAYASHGCFYPGTPCAKILFPPTGSNPSPCAGPPTIAHSTYFINAFRTLICRMPGGYYQGTDTVPTEVICSRVKSVWQKRY